MPDAEERVVVIEAEDRTTVVGSEVTADSAGYPRMVVVMAENRTTTVDFLDG